MKTNLATLDYSNAYRDIVERCQIGDRQAQFALYKQYNKAMYNVCLRMLQHEHDAEDVLQTSFVQVFRRIGDFRFESAIGAWIKRIVVNHCINHLKQKRLSFVEMDANYDASYFDEDDDPPTYGLSVERVKKALLELPDGFRTVFSLYAMEGYDHQEIAEIMGISEATSKSQYCRARRKLKELLSNSTG